MTTRERHLRIGSRRMLGWAPQFTLDEGLDRTIAWYGEFC